MKKVLILLAFIYGVIFISSIGHGINESYYYSDVVNDCSKPLKRYEYIVPGKPLGCWLGETP